MQILEARSTTTRTSESWMEASPCRFCDIAAGHASRWPDSTLFETKSYVVIASIGALVPGWAMVLPRGHALNLVDAFSDSEFCKLRLQVSMMLASAYPSRPVRMFEHGAQTDRSQAGCGVDHAHLHLVPLHESLVPWLQQEREPANWRRLALSRVPDAVHGREYLLYCDTPKTLDPKCWLSFPGNPVSQYFRRIVAAAQDASAQYDYQVHPFLTNVAETQARLVRAARRMGFPSTNHRPAISLSAESRGPDW